MYVAGILTARRSEDDVGTERTVAGGVLRLQFEVVGGPDTEAVHSGGGLVANDRIHHPLAMRLSSIGRVEQQVT